MRPGLRLKNFRRSSSESEVTWYTSGRLLSPWRPSPFFEHTRPSLRRPPKRPRSLLLLKFAFCFSPLSQLVAVELLSWQLGARNDFLCRARVRLLDLLLLNRYRRSHVHQFEKLNDISVSHPNASVAVRLANFVFVFRAVNVNKAITRIGIGSFKPIEPENPRKNKILCRR